MTKNQIEYLKLRETQRSNLVQEGLTQQRDQRSYEIGLREVGVKEGSLAESQRHNLASEAQARASLDETSRHNVAMEQYNTASLTEAARHNRAGEIETNRHNVVGEQQNANSLIEQSRHNRAQEAIGRSQVGATYSSIQLGYSQLGETQRANQAREAETNRSNIAHEQETTRSNVAKESETVRHNQASESLNRNQINYNRNYQEGQLRQGDKKLTIDSWKTAIEGVGTAADAASKIIPLFN